MKSCDRTVYLQTMDIILEAFCSAGLVYLVFAGPVHALDAVRWYRAAK